MDYIPISDEEAKALEFLEQIADKKVLTEEEYKKAEAARKIVKKKMKPVIEADKKAIEFAQEVQEGIQQLHSDYLSSDLAPALDPSSPAFDPEARKEACIAAAEAIDNAIEQFQSKTNKEAIPKPTADAIIAANKELQQVAFDTLQFFAQQAQAAAKAMQAAAQDLGQKLKEAAAAMPKYSEEFLSKVADLEPYLIIELSNEAKTNPEFAQYTIWDIYEQGFNEAGDPIEGSKFLQLIQIAQLRKKKYEQTEEAAEAVSVLSGHIERLKKEAEAKKITARPTEKVDFPLDKPNREIWDLLSGTKYNNQLQLATVTIDTSKGKKKRETGIIYGISFDKLEEIAPNLKITKQLTQYDKRVYIAASALYNAGNEVTTATQIYSAMGNKGKPKAADVKKINDSLTKMGAARVYLNNEHEAKKYTRYPVFKYDADLLPFERVSASVNGQITETAIHLFREPPLMTFAKERKQITTLDLQLLESPVNKTEANLAIDDYLIERISHIKKGNAQPKILYDTLYEKCRITTKKQRQRTPEKIKRYLDHYKSCKFIYDYEEETDGIYIFVSKAAKSKKP